MSGGVGPTYSDVSLPKEQEHELKQSQDPTSSKLKKARVLPFLADQCPGSHHSPISQWHGLVLPIAYIFEGIMEGNKQGIKAAAPHVFILASQVFMDGVVFSDRFSTPIRVFVPVFYNSKRIFTLVEWLKNEFSKEEVYGTSARRLYLGRMLAVANLAFWSLNLFGFLLLVHLPASFKKYYSAHKESKD
ncbi:uncharacterized protein Pyn_00990 [Prunus yedoensis var. nudiflora]|uniref:DUF7733 domain-containing protein n=1 Tax=Prunus yedoensis var. nudiflora TaxID=2094558 RepID=A0A314UIC9_PRUYE|nr:uncharacterized protein Pyn_00990 [Prunus yedoensis var. nudiflora]